MAQHRVPLNACTILFHDNWGPLLIAVYCTIWRMCYVCELLQRMWCVCVWEGTVLILCVCECVCMCMCMSMCIICVSEVYSLELSSPIGATFSWSCKWSYSVQVITCTMAIWSIMGVSHQVVSFLNPSFGLLSVSHFNLQIFKRSSVLF